MVSVIKDTILKKLKALYGNAFHDGKWHIALQALEWQALEWRGKNRGMLEASCLSEVTRIADIREQRRRDLADVQEKLNPELTHPPPCARSVTERPLKNSSSR